VTVDRFDAALQHCADLGVSVEWDDMGEYRRGGYERDDGKITLSPRLTVRQATATLGHELGHEKFGHGCSNPTNERRAWEYGAALLVTPAAYRAAEEAVGHRLAALAIELGVTPKLIEAWRRWWETKGQFLDLDDDLDGPLNALDLASDH